MHESNGTVVFGVTIDYQLRYHDGLYQRLADEGWDVHLVSGPGRLSDEFAHTPGLTVHELQMARSPRLGQDVRSLLRWLRLIRAVRPEVIVVGTPKAGLLGSIASRLTGVPVCIYELHGLRLESATGPLRRLLGMTERFACAAATRVIAVSPSLRRRALEEGLTIPKKLRVLGDGSPNGVDVERFARAADDVAAQRDLRESLGIGVDEPVVTYVGRLTADKGIEALADAMGSVQSVTDAHLLVVGGVDDESGQLGKDKLQEMLPRVSFVGEVEDVAPYLAISNVFCLPSRREGLPTAVLEAFAARVPVVATRATGIVDVVEHGRTGRLAPIDDAAVLAGLLQDALMGVEETRRMVATAETLVRERFAASIVQRRWVDTLNSLLEDTRAA